MSDITKENFDICSEEINEVLAAFANKGPSYFSSDAKQEILDKVEYYHNNIEQINPTDFRVDVWGPLTEHVVLSALNYIALDLGYQNIIVKHTEELYNSKKEEWVQKILPANILGITAYNKFNSTVGDLVIGFSSDNAPGELVPDLPIIWIDVKVPMNKPYRDEKTGKIRYKVGSISLESKNDFINNFGYSYNNKIYLTFDLDFVRGHTRLANNVGNFGKKDYTCDW